MSKALKNTIEIELEHLEVEGKLTPHGVVNAARNPKHPLHKRFEWDNSIAGERYRLVQARALINEVKVVFMGRVTEKYWSATFPVEKVENRAYYNLKETLSKREIYKQVMEAAVKEIDYWEKKYQHLTELKNIVNKPLVEKVAKKYKIATS